MDRKHITDFTGPRKLAPNLVERNAEKQPQLHCITANRLRKWSQVAQEVRAEMWLKSCGLPGCVFRQQLGPQIASPSPHVQITVPPSRASDQGPSPSQS